MPFNIHGSGSDAQAAGIFKRAGIGEDVGQGAEFGLRDLCLWHGSRQRGQLLDSLLRVACPILHQELECFLSILTCRIIQNVS